jgi:hypothetical protein
MLILAIAAVLGTPQHLEGDVTAAGGDYALVSFQVPAGTAEIQIAHSDGSDYVILDWGLWAPEGYRGWGGGLTDDAVIGVAQSSRGYLPGAITPGMWTVVIGKAQLGATGGHYIIDVTCRDNATLPVMAQAPYAAVTLSPTRRWYKGDFHVHSDQSGDAHATLTQITDLARSRHLDFVNLSDHNTVAQHALIAALQPGLTDFLYLRGAEITTYAGHGNAVGIHSYVDHRVGLGGVSATTIIDDVVGQGGIFIVNHPALDLGTACIGCAWKHADTPWDKVAGIEVITGAWEVSERAFTPLVAKMWDDLEDQGYRIAAIGGSDDHTAGVGANASNAAIGSPTTLVLADDLSEAAIIDAIKHRHTLVQLRGPDDPLVDATVDTKDGGKAEIGDEIDGVDHVHLDVHVTGGVGIFVQLWRDGAKLAQLPVDSDDFHHGFDDATTGKEQRYRIELINDAGNRLVMTSNFYVHGVAASGGCQAGGDAGGLALGLALLATARRRRR